MTDAVKAWVNALNATEKRPLRWDYAEVFGSGWTIETDPTRKGWRCITIPESIKGASVFGQPNKEGCASVIVVKSVDDTCFYDVAIYDKAHPKQVVEAIKANDHTVLTGELVGYFKVPVCPGWGCRVMQAIELVRQGRESEISLDRH